MAFRKFSHVFSLEYISRYSLYWHITNKQSDLYMFATSKALLVAIIRLKWMWVIIPQAKSKINGTLNLARKPAVLIITY